MLLYELTNEQAKSFMRLVKEFISVDNKVKKEEENITNKYLQGLGMSKEQLNDISVQDAFLTLNKSEQKIKNTVYFELLSVALIDGEYETSEVNFLEKLSDKFNISRATKIALANYIFELDNSKEIERAKLEVKLKNIIEK